MTLLLFLLAALPLAEARGLHDNFEGSDWSLQIIEQTRPQMVALHKTALPFTVKHNSIHATSCQCGSPEKPFDGFTRTNIWTWVRFFNLTHEEIWDYDDVLDPSVTNCTDVRGDGSAHHDYLCFSRTTWPACECLMLAKEYITDPRNNRRRQGAVYSHPYQGMDWIKWKVAAKDLVPKDWLSVEDHYFHTDSRDVEGQEGTWLVETVHSVVDHGEVGETIKRDIESGGLSRLHKLVAQLGERKPDLAQLHGTVRSRDEL
ncbi:protein ORF147 [Cyprinid herpesvirus 1]|uniref:Protein ORF147 n=1 Tax=Cyprinid herpesvirus 1 TaxID=317858 RepID=K7PBE4_9VIRU|nr:protein ORF147 [Cyprinid herpesvirus 1]AFJ20434.1 protein ORF147 [Cyprinid herpesvirus 1]